jgi:hypothetical protein
MRILNSWLAMAAAIQDEIAGWLRTVGENGAAAWFERYWTGERDNYTNASAGSSGNNKAQGIESRCPGLGIIRG